MQNNRGLGGGKKSLYLFLCSLLGMMLFLVLHRVVIFFILVFSGANGSLSYGSDYVFFAAIDYFTLILVLMFGSWYGIWLGMYWYEKVYEEGSVKGFKHHVWQKYWPKKGQLYGLEQKIDMAKQKLEDGMWELEGAVKDLPQQEQPAIIKRRIVRKKAPKKLKV